MEIIKFKSEVKELPVKILFSLEALYKEVERYANDPKHPYYDAAVKIYEKLMQYPELRTGIEDLTQLDKYEEPIMTLTDKLFPPPLLTNEIKALLVPFQFHALRPTTRFSNIVKNAGKDFEMKITGFEKDNYYIMACSFILGKYYKQPLNSSFPLSMEIYDQNTGITRHYRMLLNGDFMEVEKTDSAPELTQADIDELILHGDNLELWKTKIPPNSYLLKGFGIMNLYDATAEMTIANIRSLFLRNDKDVFCDFRDNLRILFGINDLEVGYSMYNTQSRQVISTFMNKETQSLFLDKNESGGYQQIFCEGVNCHVLQDSQILAIPDVEWYAEASGHNVFSKKLKTKGIGSVMLAPIRLDSGEMQLLELASPRKHELNSLNAVKLKGILSFVKIATQRYMKERENLVESTIQENYTSIHPAVKWRFTEAANHFNKDKATGAEMPVLEEIVFENIYPLYGQSDIKGSSTARNNAIQADLDLQLNLVIDTFKKIMAIRPLPIYKNLIYRVNNCLHKVRGGLKAGDEVGILEFLKTRFTLFSVISKNSVQTSNSLWTNTCRTLILN